MVNGGLAGRMSSGLLGVTRNEAGM
jgi:hypothetical protein